VFSIFFLETPSEFGALACAFVDAGLVIIGVVTGIFLAGPGVFI